LFAYGNGRTFRDVRSGDANICRSLVGIEMRASSSASQSALGLMEHD
jgi:hypothetical protein